MPHITLSAADAERLNNEKIKKIPTGTPFVVGEEVVVCKSNLVILKDAWTGECKCQVADCATRDTLPVRRKISGAPQQQAGQRDGPRVRTRAAEEAPDRGSRPEATTGQETHRAEATPSQVRPRPTPEPPSPPASTPPPRPSPPPAPSRPPPTPARPAYPPRRRSWVSIPVAAILLVAGIGVGTTLSKRPVPSVPITAFAEPQAAYVIAPGLNIRQGPGKDYPKADEPLVYAQKVTAYGKASATDGGTWLFVRTGRLKTGFINAGKSGAIPPPLPPDEARLRFLRDFGIDLKRKGE